MALQAGRPVGIGRLASMPGVAVSTLLHFHEPYLMRLGLATATPHGRVALSPAPERGLRLVGAAPDN